MSLASLINALDRAVSAVVRNVTVMSGGALFGLVGAALLSAPRLAEPIHAAPLLGDSSGEVIDLLATSATSESLPTPSPEPEPEPVLASVDLDPPYSALLTQAIANATAEETILRRGDALVDVFRRAGVDRVEAAAAAHALVGVFDARRLRAGQPVQLFLAGGPEQTRLDGFVLTPETARTIEVSRRYDGRFFARDIQTPLTRRLARAQGSITESLYADAVRAGIHDRTIAEIADLLAYSVDFQREIMPGDEFEILVEEWVDEDGRMVKPGELQYIRFTPSNRELAYWRFDPGDGPGYYDAKGESAKRFLMRTPINGARLSSHFGKRRHPVLGYTRMHKGTDFAAPRGTPIYAAGDGVVERANVYGSFGNYVRIRHAHGYKTAYAHLNGFHRRTRAGNRVKQGQVIGYVGTTGRSTGPHLHYEVHRNGDPVNPMRLDAPTGRILEANEVTEFEVERARLDAERAIAEAPAPPRTLVMAQR